MAVKKRIISATQTNTSQDIKLSKKTVNKKWVKDDILKHIMTGLSYMVPVLVLYSLVRALEQLMPVIMLPTTVESELIQLVNSGENASYIKYVMSATVLLRQLKDILFQMAIPLFAAFTANSIGGKSALILGFLGGFVATTPIVNVDIYNNQLIKSYTTPSGFLGAMVIAVIMGYTVKYLNEKIKMDNRFLAIKSSLIIPVTGLLLCIGMTIFIINPVVYQLSTYIKEILLGSKVYGEYIYSILVAIGTTFDFGGPINKTTGLVCSGLFIEGIFPVTARTLSVVIPPIGMGLSTIIDKYIVGKKVYNQSFCDAGKTSLILGLLGISEGSLPFALENPKFVVPLNIMGSIIGTVVSISLGAVQEFPESAIWAWFFAEGFLAYITGILVGTLFISVGNILYRNKLIKNGKLIV